MHRISNFSRWLLTAVTASIVAWPASAAASFTVTDIEVSFDEANGLGRYDITVQIGEQPMNRIIMHRVVRVNAWHVPIPPKGPIVLLPSGGSTFEVYGVGGEGDSVRDRLALDGFDVYGLTPRPALIEAGYCGEHDCSVMAEWGLETYVSDAEIVSLYAALASGGKRPVIGGQSLGAMIAIAAINEHPLAYAGALLWEGTLVQPDPGAQAVFAAVCDQLDQALGAGVVYDDQGNPFLQATVFLGISDPESESPFAPGFTNAMWLNYLTTTPFDPPDGEAPGYAYLAGDFFSGWAYAQSDLVWQVAEQLVTYEPLALMRDYKCAYAGESTFVDRLDRFRGPALSLQSGIGFGDANEGTLELMTRAEITRVTEPDFGHMDWLVGDPAATADAISGWLDADVVPRWHD